MFDFRYHVASLAAVFLALVIGILVGVGVSGRGFVDKSEKKIFQDNIQQLQASLDTANGRVSQLEQQQLATSTLVKQAYPALMSDRLLGKRIAIIVVGRDDGSTGSSVEQALQDSGALDVVRYRALKVPIDPVALRGALIGHKQLAGFAGPANVGALGRELARELVNGGKAPLWDALSSQLVEERRGTGNAPADGVVVIRAVPPQANATARFLAGVYSGLASSGVPAVGVELAAAGPSAVPAFTRSDLSTVNDVDLPLGRLALVLLLAGGEQGSYGIGKQAARDGLLPPIVPLTLTLTTPTTTSG